ncbi:MAG TPA: hypothetical protein VGK46_08570, partial [Saprospiraceae bacterium]
MKQKTLFLIIFITLSGFTGTKYNQIAGETTLYNTVYKVVQPDGDIRESWAINKALNKVSQAGEAIELKNPAYNVTFSARGITVTPTSGGPQLSWSADFKEPVAPRFDDDKIVYERGSVVEQYLIKQSTIEQQFIIHKPLNPKEAFFSISGTVQSKGEFEPTRNGWRWKNELGAVSLGDVTVFDASKKKFPARMEVTKDGTSITLETKFYQDAVYPITIDPEFGSDDFRISHVGPDTETVGYSGTNASVAFCPISTVSYPKGIYMVVWVGNVSGKNDIYGQRIDGKTGALIGGEIRICNMGPDNTSYAASAPDVAASGSEFFVVWSGDDASIADDKFEIFGQRVGAVAGTLSGSRVRISTTWTDNTAAYDASSPAVAYNSTWSPGSIDGSYLVVWHADHVFDDQNEIFSQGVDTQGNLISTNKRVSNMGTDGNALYDALRPDVVWNSTANTYLVAWHGDHEAVGDTQNEIFVRRVDGSDAGHGNVLGTSEVRISDMGPSGNTSYTALDAAVAYNSTNNNFLVAWHGDDDALGVNDEFEIYGQIVSSTGTVVSANNFFRISSMGTNGLTAYAGQNASVTYDPLFNHYFVSWHGDDNTSPLIDNENEIFGQVLDNAGAAVGSRTRI